MCWGPDSRQLGRLGGDQTNRCTLRKVCLVAAPGTIHFASQYACCLHSGYQDDEGLRQVLVSEARGVTLACASMVRNLRELIVDTTVILAQLSDLRKGTSWVRTT